MPRSEIIQMSIFRHTLYIQEGARLMKKYIWLKDLMSVNDRLNIRAGTRRRRQTRVQTTDDIL